MSHGLSVKARADWVRGERERRNKRRRKLYAKHRAFRPNAVTNPLIPSVSKAEFEP